RQRRHGRPPARTHRHHAEEIDAVNPATRERLFGYDQAFANPVTVWITVGLAAVLLACPLLILLLSRLGRVSAEHRAELFRRYRSWLVLIPLMLVPILLGAA